MNDFVEEKKKTITTFLYLIICNLPSHLIKWKLSNTRQYLDLLVYANCKVIPILDFNCSL